MRGRWLILLVVATIGLLLLMRTSPTPQPVSPLQESAPPSSSLGERFESARCGSLTCNIVWQGGVPTVRPISLFQAKVRPGGKMDLPNPNAPRIGKNGELADCFVSLRTIDLSRSASWNLPAVKVESTQADYVVMQGDRRGRLGIVRRGGQVEFVARDASMQSARARGAAFFQQMLFVPDQPVQRTLADAGIVELSSGSGHFWMRAYLSVSDHPYVGITNEDGDVAFENVPEGTYELVCWKANWHIARIERDPEWLFQASLDYMDAVEKKQSIRVSAGKKTEAAVTFRADDFRPANVTR